MSLQLPRAFGRFCEYMLSSTHDEMDVTIAEHATSHAMEKYAKCHAPGIHPFQECVDVYSTNLSS
jgi:hypothetical protein